MGSDGAGFVEFGPLLCEKLSPTPIPRVPLDLCYPSNSNQFPTVLLTTGVGDRTRGPRYFTTQWQSGWRIAHHI